MDTVHVSVTDWLSATEESFCPSPRTKRLFTYSKDTIAHKRRRLNDHPRRARERSWSDNDAALLPDLLYLPLEELRSVPVSPSPVGLQKMDASGAMDPPPTPSSSGKPRAATPSQTPSCSARSNASSRDPSDAIKSASYRDGVLEANGVIFRHERLALPFAIAQCTERTFSKKSEEMLMSLSTAEKLSDQLFTIDGDEEHHFLKVLDSPGPFPPTLSDDAQFKDMRCTNGRFFNEEAMPRSTDLVFPKIVRPSPDYAYGYNTKTFSRRQRNVLERSNIYNIAIGLMFPFLVIEGKSQACGLNVWQASNQCAGAGSACVKAALTLFGQLSDGAKDCMEKTECISYSVAVDTVAALLYVHWSEEPGQYFLQCIEQYWIRKPSDLIRLQSHLQSIMAWGLGPRLAKIKRSVDDIVDNRDSSRKRSIGNVEA